ncbi:MAG: radical SAM protein [Oscillospiraceae bacterium]|nr:radical SAM protein [Oscillospiraceae bacterium]
MSHSNISIFIPHAGCPHACSFCSQNTISGAPHAPTTEEVRETIFSAYGYITDKTARAETEIAFFGGSFTAIPRDYMISLLEAANEFIGEDGFKGVRISTRPDCINGEILDILKKYHVTAIELGAQSMCDRVLEMNERGHTARDVEKSSALIRAYGFELGLQMMTGLYGSYPEDDICTINRIAELSPDTVRIYPTAIIDGTKLGELFKSGEYVPYPFEKCVEICAYADKLFHSRSIRIIRMGLHAERSLEEKLLGGFYHPAFAEIVRSELFRQAFERFIDQTDSSAEMTVSPCDRSAAAGHKKSNVIYFADKNIGLIFKEDKAVPRDHFFYRENKYCIYDETGSVICT